MLSSNELKTVNFFDNFCTDLSSASNSTFLVPRKNFSVNTSLENLITTLFKLTCLILIKMAQKGKTPFMKVSSIKILHPFMPWHSPLFEKRSNSMLPYLYSLIK